MTGAASAARAPVVTVLMAVFNGARTVGQAIGSTLAQSYSDFELIVIDDASTDGTAARIRAFADSRIRVVENKENIGLTKSLNKGLAMARGRYIARMDADDINLPDRFRTQVDFLDRRPDIGIVGTDADLIDPRGRPLHPQGPFHPATPDLVHWHLFFRCCVNHPSVMMRKRVLEDLNGYDPACRYAQDYDLWLRAARRTRMANISKSLIRIRKHPRSVSIADAQRHDGYSVRVLRAAIEKQMAIPVDTDTARAMRDVRYAPRLTRREAFFGTVESMSRVFCSRHRLSAVSRFGLAFHRALLYGKFLSQVARKNLRDFLELAGWLGRRHPLRLAQVALAWPVGLLPFRFIRRHR